MNRNKSLAAALPVLWLAAGGAADAAPAPARPGGPVTKTLDALLDPERITDRLRSLGLADDQVAEIVRFTGLPREEQASVLRDAGLVDPGGDLAHPDAGDYVLGQFLVARGLDPARGVQLQLASGRLDPKDALALARQLRPDDLIVGAEEIDQQRRAFGIDAGRARLRAQLQRAATLLRPYLAQLAPGLAAVWIDDDGPEPRLVAGTAGGGDVEQALGGTDFAGLPIEIRPVKLNRSGLVQLATAVREESGATAARPGARPKVRATVTTDPTTSTVRLRPVDRVEEERLRGNVAVRDRMAKGEAVIEAPRAIGPQALPGGFATNTGGCTWGFTVANEAGGKGLSTAAHCSGEGGYGTLVSTFHAAEVQLGASDTARHTVNPFWYDHLDNSVVRTGAPDLDITSRTSWWSTGIGDVVCHQGRATGHSCGWVTSDFVSPWWVPGSGYFVQVEGPTLNQSVGDSGGPWFYGNSAHGIHTGGLDLYGSYSEWGLSIYGAVNFAESDVHFTVLTK